MKQPGKMHNRHIPALLLGLALVPASPAAESGGPLAKHLVALSNRAANPRGLCVVADGGGLAREIAKATGFFVISQEPDAAAMQAMAAQAARGGLLGTRMVVVESSPDRVVARLLWHTQPAKFPAPLYNFRSTETAYDPPQPIAVGGLAVFAGADGAIRAHDVRDGRQRWTFHTGGRL